MRRSLSLLALTVGLTSTAHAGAGENGLAFLKVGAGTSAVAMGEAYASQVSDATATYWNPAGLARIGGTDVLLMHNEFIADLRYEYASAARSFGRHGVGISFYGLFTSDLEGRDENGAITGEVGFHDIALTLGYAYAVNDELSLGGSVKYLREFIGDPGATEDHVSTGVAFDVGAQYHLDQFRFGASLRNLAGDFTFNEVEVVSQSGTGGTIGGEPFKIPVAIQGGVTYLPDFQFFDGGVEFSVEARQVRAEDPSILFGTRYRYRNVAALGVGYRSGLDTENVSFGLDVFRNDLRVGYAFVPFQDDLGNSHRISIGYHAAN